MERKFIAKELFVTTNKMRRYLDQKHQKNGLYLSQARLLIYLYYNSKNDDSIYQVDIEKHFQIRKASVTGMLDSLNKINLIKRVESTKDKRKKKILLTKDGEKKALKAIDTIKGFEDNLSSIVSEQEFIILNDSLTKINNWLMEKEQEDEKVI